MSVLISFTSHAGLSQQEDDDSCRIEQRVDENRAE